MTIPYSGPVDDPTAIVKNIERFNQGAGRPRRWIGSVYISIVDEPLTELITHFNQNRAFVHNIPLRVLLVQRMYPLNYHVQTAIARHTITVLHKNGDPFDLRRSNLDFTLPGDINGSTAEVRISTLLREYPEAYFWGADQIARYVRVDRAKAAKTLKLLRGSSRGLVSAYRTIPNYSGDPYGIPSDICFIAAGAANKDHTARDVVEEIMKRAPKRE